MDKALEIYTNILKEYLSKCFFNQQIINPIELNKERFKTKAIFTACIFYLKNNPKREDCKIVKATNDWLTNTFADKNLFSLVISQCNSFLTKLIDEKLCSLINLESIDIPTLYETLLGIESENENNGTKTSNAKNYRNKLGSYYTPAELANSVTKKTIDTFFHINFGIEKMSSAKIVNESVLNKIPSITFADFSSGGGNFLTEILQYFETVAHNLQLPIDRKNQLLKSIAKNISAFDVDCLALEVAKLNLLLRISQPKDYSEFSERFVHGNFLLVTDFPTNESLKIDTFASGFIYHEKLSISKNKLKKYDIVLGNPPWEKIRFEEKKFFALYSPSISSNHFKASRTTEITEVIERNKHLAEFSKEFQLQIEKTKKDLKRNSFFELSNNGELNTYALFTNAAIKLKTQRGVVGLVLKSAIVTSQVNQKLFQFMTKNNLVIAVYDFINRKKIFNIDSRERFCFLLLGNAYKKQFQVAMNLSVITEIETIVPNIELSYNRLKLLNPFTGMLPNLSTKSEANFLLRVSHEFSFFKNIFDSVRFGRIVHLTSHSEFISKRKSDDNTPIYEGKFFNQFDGKYSGFNGIDDELRYGSKSSSVLLDENTKREKNSFPESRFFINTEKWLQLSKHHKEKFMLAWRSLTSATNSRTCIATILPFIPASQSVQFLTTNANNLLYLCGLFNSVVFDFILKKKLSGIDLTQSVINQMPVPNIEQITSIITFNGSKASFKQHISLLVFSLLQNDIRLNPLFKTLDLKTPINESRFELIRKIDLLFMLLYKLNHLEVELVLSAFQKQYSKEDLKWFNLELKKNYSAIIP
ncbi:Eco57I restriction-modification methylase domain-containing protein [Chryseobacterium gossypii]|uniref:Eco57I restriction-modification methylase domain-containing protein n=1 Tax=Chryseobacterium gossypii TaxID=3231602 RepID=UPI00352326C5